MYVPTCLAMRLSICLVPFASLYVSLPVSLVCLSVYLAWVVTCLAICLFASVGFFLSLKLFGQQVVAWGFFLCVKIVLCAGGVGLGLQLTPTS